MRIQQIHQALAERGAKPLHITRILRAWLHGQPLDTGTRRQQS